MNASGSRLRIAAAAAVLFGVNAYVCRELFRTPYLNQMPSIEAAFIAIARYASQNFGDLTWFPLWYNGIPYQNTYPPLLHLMVAVVIRATGAEPGLAYHAVTGVLYCAGAVTLFALAYRLSGRLIYSFSAGAVYSLLAPSAFLVADIARDLGSVWRPRRLQTLVHYGEGPHTAGLTLLPVAILALDVALRRTHPVWTVLAAVAFAATVLTNWLAAAALGAAVLAYLIANWSAANLRKAALIGGLAYCLAAPWIPPSTMKVIQFNAKMIGGDFSGVYKTLPLFGALIGACLLGLILLFRRWNISVVVRFSAVYAFLMAEMCIRDRLPLFGALIGACLLGLILLFRRWNISVVVRFSAVYAFLMAVLVLPAEYLKIYILPQPHRYHLEMEIGIAMLLPFLARPLIDRLPDRAQVMAALVLAGLAILPAKEYRRYARIQMTPIDISKTAEYRIAKWFDRNMQGRRVLATGSVSFWMNVWTDTPQLGGGFDQGTVNYMNRVANYVIYSDDGVAGDKLATSELWLKAFGISAVEPAGAESGEAYHPFRHPEKFDAYPLLWRDGGEAVYRVPLASESMAHVMTRADLVSRTPVNGIDTEPLKPYVAALDNPAYPRAEFRWTSRHSAVIRAVMQPGQILSVQITGHAGWRASRGTVGRDAFGFLVIDPQCAGDCTVELSYDGGLEMTLARWVSWLALLGSLTWIAAATARPALRSLSPRP